jgi:hypothetical protein
MCASARFVVENVLRLDAAAEDYSDPETSVVNSDHEEL